MKQHDLDRLISRILASRMRAMERVTTLERLNENQAETIDMLAGSVASQIVAALEQLDEQRAYNGGDAA